MYECKCESLGVYESGCVSVTVSMNAIVSVWMWYFGRV